MKPVSTPLTPAGPLVHTLTLACWSRHCRSTNSGPDTEVNSSMRRSTWRNCFRPRDLTAICSGRNWRSSSGSASGRAAAAALFSGFCLHLPSIQATHFSTLS